MHPESYPITERMANSLGVSVSELIENPTQISSIDFRAFENEAGKYTIADIREELLKPGRDPRDRFVVPKFREDVKDIADLQEGMELEGTVTNVTNFGAFVDLGVHQEDPTVDVGHEHAVRCRFEQPQESILGGWRLPHRAIHAHLSPLARRAT